MVKTRRSYKKKYSRKNNKSKNFRKSKRRHKKRGGDSNIEQSNKPESNNFCSEEIIKKFLNDNNDIIPGKKKLTLEQKEFLFKTLLKITINDEFLKDKKFDKKTLLNVCKSLDDEDKKELQKLMPEFKEKFNNLLSAPSGGQRRGGTIDPTLDRLAGIFMIGFCVFFSWLMGKCFINPLDRRCVYYDPLLAHRVREAEAPRPVRSEQARAPPSNFGE